MYINLAFLIAAFLGRERITSTVGVGMFPSRFSLPTEPLRLARTLQKLSL